MRSFRMHRPRSGFCHAGWCQQCRVTLSDGSVVLACQTAADSAASAPASRLVARVLGRIAERLPPWFYEHRFLRPRFLRQFYLRQLRRFSGAPVFPAVPVTAAAVHRERECDTLVVGGGLAGLTVATALAERGRRVILVEAEEPGGRARFQPAQRPLIEPALLAAQASGVEVIASVLCVGIYEDPRRALCIADDGTLVVHFTDIVVATGAYDRLPAFPGNDLPGVIGGRAFERLASAQAIPRDASIGVWGDEAGIAAALRAARAAGLAIAWTAGGARDVAADARHFPGAAIERAHGRQRLAGVDLRGVGRVGCSILVVAFTQPTYELQTQLGLQPMLWGDPPVLRFGASATDHMLVVGEAAGQGSCTVGDDGLASDADARFRSGAAASAAGHAGATMAPSLPDEALVCLCEDVRAADIRAAVAEGYRDIELVKRHTGAGTGPCQGKLCHAELLRCAQLAGIEARLPTARPLVRPVRLHSFAGKR